MAMVILELQLLLPSAQNLTKVSMTELYTRGVECDAPCRDTRACESCVVPSCMRSGRARAECEQAACDRLRLCTVC